MECRWKARLVLWRLLWNEKFCQALANCTDWSPPDPMIRAGSRTAARSQDPASSQLKPLPARHELSMVVFHPPHSVDMDPVLRSYSPATALRTFARQRSYERLLSPLQSAASRQFDLPLIPYGNALFHRGLLYDCSRQAVTSTFHGNRVSRCFTGNHFALLTYPCKPKGLGTRREMVRACQAYRATETKSGFGQWCRASVRRMTADDPRLFGVLLIRRSHVS